MHSKKHFFSALILFFLAPAFMAAAEQPMREGASTGPDRTPDSTVSPRVIRYRTAGKLVPAVVCGSVFRKTGRMGDRPRPLRRTPGSWPSLLRAEDRSRKRQEV